MKTVYYKRVKSAYSVSHMIRESGLAFVSKMGFVYLVGTNIYSLFVLEVIMKF